MREHPSAMKESWFSHMDSIASSSGISSEETAPPKGSKQNPQLVALYSQAFFYCSVCDQEKVVEELYDPNWSIGNFILCKTCAAIGKHCSLCKQYQMFDKFPRDTGTNRGGVAAYCKPCKRAYSRERYKEKGKSKSAREREHTRRCKLYGLTPQEYQAMYDMQNGVCASCGNPSDTIDKRSGKPFRFHIDHDHESGKVRGLLCGGCNVALGHLRDDPERIRGLLTYAEKWQNNTGKSS